MATALKSSPAWPSTQLHLQRDSIDDIQGVDDIAQRLAHLPAMGISHNGMEVDLRQERACEAAPPHQTPLPPQSPASEPQVPRCPTSPFSTFLDSEVLTPL